MTTFNPQIVLIGFYTWLVPMVLVGVGFVVFGVVRGDKAAVITGGLFALVGSFLIWLINQ